jgi:hypothetical protein
MARRLPQGSRSPIYRPKLGAPRKRPERTRRAYSAKFYAHLGPPPDVIDLPLARLYWMRIVDLIDRGGWGRNERTVLRRLEARWRKRMLGDDHRWLMVGARAGRLDRGIEQVLRPTPAPGWGALDQLLEMARRRQQESQGQE